MPLQQRVHWGSFCRPDMGLGMGLPSLGMGDLTGDFKFLNLSVGDTPRDKNRKKKKPTQIQWVFCKTGQILNHEIAFWIYY